MIPDNILERIKKLLALSSSPNQHEAESALAKAYELMVQYNLSLGDIKEKDGFETTVNRSGSKSQPEDIFIFTILKNYFHVFIIQHYGARQWVGNTFSILGEPHNIAIAQHIFEFLKQTFASLWKSSRPELVSSRMKGARKNRIKKAYFYGLYIGLSTKLEDAQKSVYQENGLIRVNDAALMEYKMKQFPDVKEKKENPKVKDNEALRQGYDHGKKIEIYKPIQSANQNIKQLN